MNKKTNLLLILALVATATAAYFLVNEDSPIVTDSASVSAENSSVSAPVSSYKDQNVVLQEQDTLPEADEGISKESVAELYETLATTVKNREDAEESLRVIELKVTALEAQLNDIETMGDNPAEVQDETLDTFQAIFAEYQDTTMAYEQAKAKEEWIREKLDQTRR